MPDGRILGAQAVGLEGVEKRIDVIAMAIQFGGTVHDLAEAELCYAPQFGAAKDPVNLAGHDRRERARRRHAARRLARARRRRRAASSTCASPRSSRAGHIPGAINLPLSQLRARYDELPRDREIWLCCGVGQRAYYATRFLRSTGTGRATSPAATRRTARSGRAAFSAEMAEFTPLSALIGGALIGLAASLLLLLNGRIAGVSGIVGGLLPPRRGDAGWRTSFAAGLIAGGVVLRVVAPSSLGLGLGASFPTMVLAGVLVGVGTQLGSGCTSGHGVCGMSRGSARSVVATSRSWPRARVTVCGGSSRTRGGAVSPSLAAFLAGVLFAAGLGVSGMTQPAKVLAFLDVAGRWDPSLAFVMLGAIAVHAPLARRILVRPAPVLAPGFSLPVRRDVDARLVVGAATFGVGWGLSGLCPGPAITLLASARPIAVVFVAAMLAGMAAERAVERTPGRPTPRLADRSRRAGPPRDAGRHRNQMYCARMRRATIILCTSSGPS